MYKLTPCVTLNIFTLLFNHPCVTASFNHLKSQVLPLKYATLFAIKSGILTTKLVFMFTTTCDLTTENIIENYCI